MTQTLPSWMVETDPDSEAGPATGTGSEPWPATVVGRQQVAEGVISLELEPLREQAVVWTPGAHLDVHLPAAAGAQRPPVRQYSLCGDPAAATLRIAVLREDQGRGGSSYLHDAVGEGDRLLLGGPRNNFELEAASSYAFVAGGIGITPLLPMMAEVRSRGLPWSLTYGGRSRSTMAFVSELVDDPRVQVVPEDTDGRLDLDRLFAQARPGCRIYCCGPEGLLAAVEHATRHWPAGALHVERFQPREDPAAAPAHAFEVLLSRSGMTLKVPPGKSILDVVAEAGLDVLSSCGEGTCGTCETDVLSGEVDHRDSLLTEAEKATGDCMMICVSRARGERLVLDA